MGVGSVLGWTHRIEPWLWFAIGIFSTVWILRNTTARRFAAGFWGGLLAGTLAPLVQFAFFPAYLANNPASAAQMRSSPFNFRLILLLLSPVIGALFGLVLGLWAWAAGKFAAMAARRPAAK